MDILNIINSVAWVASNVLIAYISVVVIAFVAGYYTLFDPSATTAGKFIFRFMLSLAGLASLLTVATFIDPSHNRIWHDYPDDIASWRPIIRFAVYSYISFTITSLAILLLVRKWWPQKIKSSPDLDLIKLRHTTEIPTIKPERSDISKD